MRHSKLEDYRTRERVERVYKIDKSNRQNLERESLTMRSGPMIKQTLQATQQQKHTNHKSTHTYRVAIDTKRQAVQITTGRFTKCLVEVGLDLCTVVNTILNGIIHIEEFAVPELHHVVTEKNHVIDVITRLQTCLVGVVRRYPALDFIAWHWFGKVFTTTRVVSSLFI